ncbi:hypothetical protein [Ensifer sp. ENS10]|uniref:hypothetical protein n=1 Tax=unclassified Ensifer TaxID=2633371 RepID=UPI0035C79EBB
MTDGSLRGGVATSIVMPLGYSIDKAYVNARKHFEITDERLGWLVERTGHLLRPVETIGRDTMTGLARAAGAT